MMTQPLIDPVACLKALVACPSVTPAEGGALRLLADILGAAGFRTERLVFSDSSTPDVENLFATIGARPPHLVFAGHTDVVPPGDAKRWSHPPFAAEVADGALYGRGAVDMKGGIAAFVAAASEFLAARGGRGRNSVVFDYRRRGRPGGQRHRQAHRLGARRGPSLRRCAGRRTDLGGASRRHREGRPARQPVRHHPRPRPPGPCRLSASCREPRPAAGAHAAPSGRAPARRGHRRLPALQSTDDQRRRRQSRLQRHPGRGDGPLQCPLQ